MNLRFTPPKSLATRAPRKSGNAGYVLLALILIVALLTIAAAAIAPSIAFQVKRDREEEMIHRGVQYSRAIQHYYKKFNRYPSKIEDLESTNNLRFLRKRYKDPITGQDFKLVHLSEVQMALAGGSIGGLSPTANAGSAAGNQFGQSANSSGVGNSPALPSSPIQGTNATGPNSGDSGTSDQSASASATSTANQPNGSDPSGASSTDKLSGQTFGGGPIAGVESTSKAQSIREFNKKDHYNEWLFIYNPQSDRGGLINAPYQPSLVGAVPIGQPGAPGMPPGFGNQGFGAQGMGGNQASPFGVSMQPAQPQQQPQRQ